MQISSCCRFFRNSTWSAGSCLDAGCQRMEGNSNIRLVPGVLRVLLSVALHSLAIHQNMPCGWSLCTTDNGCLLSMLRIGKMSWEQPWQLTSTQGSVLGGLSFPHPARGKKIELVLHCTPSSSWNKSWYFRILMMTWGFKSDQKYHYHITWDLEDSAL